MCGLTACLDLHGHPPKPETNGFHSHKTDSGDKPLEEQINDSLEIVKHRGPDARGQWISKDRRVGLGQVRLSIIDLSPDGDQPFHNHEEDVHAVVNGELYDFERYRAELAKSYTFKGQSDCEIVLGLYKHYGLSFMHHLRGEFALVLYDAKRDLLVAARDRYGIKSLYYTVHEGRLLIATEIKSFMAYGWKPEWDVPAIREHAWCQDVRTLFKGVRKLLPGHYLTCRNSGDVEIKRYWDLDYPDKRVVETRSEDEMIQGVQDRLVEAVRLRLRADVPVGVYLSGGLDSSAIAGITANLIREKGVQLGNDASKQVSQLKCFCVQFPKDSGVDESDVAQRSADWLGVELVLIYMDEEAIASRLEETAWYSESYAADVNGMGKLAMAEQVHARGFKVVVTGEGSDEHFGGYSVLTQDRLSEADESWPALFASERGMAETLDAESQKRDIFQMGKMAETKLASTSRMLNGAKIAPILSTFNPVPFAEWTDRYNTTDPQTSLAESFDAEIYGKMINKWHPLNSASYIWTKTMFPNILLRYVGDNIDMVHHVESRTPFLDHHLTEYSMKIPPSLKMKFQPETKEIKEKYILREAVKPFVTEEIYTRRKQPFMGPVQYTTGGPLHKEISRLVTQENIEQLGFVDWEAINAEVDKAFVQRDRDAFRNALSVAQLVALSKRFGIKKAAPMD